MFPKSMDIYFKARMFVFRFLLCWCVLSIAATDSMAQSLTFFYVDGRAISTEVSEESFEWTHVSDSGKSTAKTIHLSDIRSLVLTKTPAAKQIAQIRQLIEQLDSPKYREREDAEKKLSDPEFSAGYVSLIEQRADDPRLEVRFRLNRILDRLKKDRVQANLLFDTLVLRDGTLMQGDAGNFEWTGQFMGRSVKIIRSDLASVELGAAKTANAAKPQTGVAVKLFHKHQEFEADKSLRVVDFSSDPDGNLLHKKADVSSTFVPWGLKFDDSGKGYVGIPNYNLSIDSLPVGKQMIAKFNNKPGLNGIPYKGVINFDFCMPNQPTTPAGVFQFGTFIATVDSPRAFILEAFDRQGELVGTVETEKSRCGFLGIKSPTPIHRIQIRANPYLYLVDGNVDDDFALDTFYFSKPVPVALPVGQAMKGVVLRDGTRLNGRVSLNAPDKVSITTQDLGALELKLNAIEQISFGKLPARQLKTWMATTNDGSTLVVDPLRGFQSSLLKRTVKDELNCLFNASNPKRHPVEGDFEHGKSVLVYPTCRIPVAKVNFNKSGFAWPKNAKKRLQPVDKESPLGVPGKDPTPQVSEVNYKSTTAENLPTLWFSPPKPPTDGFIQLTDGQVLSLGDHRKITSVSAGNIQLQETAGGKLSIPIGQVAAISLGN